MNSIQDQLERLYNEHDYKQRLLDIEKKRQEYRKKNLRFSSLRIILIAAYFVLVVNGFFAIQLLFSRQNIFIPTLVMIVAGVGVYILWRGWDIAKNQILWFGQTCISALLLLWEVIINFDEIMFLRTQDIKPFSFLENSLFFIIEVTSILLGITIVSLIKPLFIQENIFVAALVANLAIIISIIGMYGILSGWALAKERITSAWKTYSVALVTFRCEAITSFTTLIHPNAKDIQFLPASEFESSDEDEFEVKQSGLFYSDLERYRESSRLIFSIDSLTYKIGEVELIFVVNPGNEATEFDRFVEFNEDNSQTFGIFKGIFYSLPFLKANQSSTYLIPKNITPPPLIKTTKTVRGWDGETREETVKVSQDYPWLELSSKANRQKPGRFSRRGFEEYHLENDVLADGFYTFGDDENNTRKLLSYRLMERIVKVVFPQDNNESENGIFSFFNNSNTWNIDFWITMGREKLLIAKQQQNLIFFTKIGQESAEFDNIIENFSKLYSILEVINQLDVYRVNAQKL